MNTISISSFTISLLLTVNASSQCADDANVYSFNHNGKTYEIIKENKSWTDAAACAANRGGYLAEINNAEEQEAIFSQLANAGINPADTEAQDGFSSYVWLGGNDISFEGLWALNGDNDMQALFFWQGNANGSPMNNRYNNWGNEPDNWGPEPGQDGLAMAIIPFPNGAAGKWNDLRTDNELFFVVEHNTILSTEQQEQPKAALLYPNPATDHITISEPQNVKIVEVYNTAGGRVLHIQSNIRQHINIEKLPAGVYIVKVEAKDGQSQTYKLIKK